MTLRGEKKVRCGIQSGDLGVIEDGSVFIQDGKIVSVGPTRRLENLKEVRGAIQIPVHNFIVMPGFVDPAIELSLAKPHTAGKHGAKRKKLVDFSNESLALMRLCLQHGTLNAGIRASSGVPFQNSETSVLRQLELIGKNPVGLTRIWCPEPSGLDIQRVSKSKLADVISLRVGDQRIKEAIARKLRVNLDWIGGEAEALADAIAESSAAAVQCQYELFPDERRALTLAGVTAVFKVVGTLFDSQPERCVRELVDEGGAVALGSGYNACREPNFNMQMVLALAVRKLNLTIEEAIVASTINAAYAINCADRIGSLEPGKRADVLILSLDDYHELPRRLGVNHVAMAIRDGEIAINRTKWRVGAA